MGDPDAFKEFLPDRTIKQLFGLPIKSYRKHIAHEPPCGL